MKARQRPRTWFGEDEVTAEVFLLGALVQRRVFTVTERTPLDEVHRILAEERVPAVCVVNDERELRGLVTRTDVLRALRESPTATAGAAMSSYVFAIPLDSSIEAAAALIAIENVGQVVVTGYEGELVGMVSAVDIARHLATRAGYMP
jgi:CBS domain-containing protein